jgi:hypothetical protein
MRDATTVTARFWLLALFIPLQGLAQVPTPTSVDNVSASGSLRATFRFDPDRIELVRVERLQKVAPGQVLPTPVAGKNSGAWVVLLDSSDQPLFHRWLNDPFRVRTEHHGPGGPAVHWKPATSGEFQAVLPAIPSARFVVLFSSPRDPNRTAEPAAEIARFRLDPL